MKDSTFSIPVESDEYKGLIGEKASMILKISDLEREIKNLGYNWDIVSKIPGFGKKENADDKDKDKETEKKKTLSKDGPALQRELTATRAEMEELSQKIENFLFKQYNLDNNIYRNRVRSHIQAKVNQKRQQELQKPGFFPSAPKGDI